jgi:hypothetical protein
LDLLFDGYQEGADPRPGPTFSQRRANRRKLAETPLSEFWGETMPALPDHASIRLCLPDDLVARMEAEFITEDDVRRVIHHAEVSGTKLSCPPSGRFIAHHRPSLITYWVEYAPVGDVYEVYNVYCHRMQIVRDGSGDGA